jgi:hypothetical protein
MGLESRFFVEAKTFVFSAVERKSELRVEERRKGFSGTVCLGSLSVAWLIAKVEEVIRNPGDEEFVKSFREESKAIILRRGGNKAGRFLEVAVYAEGGRRGLVMFPEGRGGRGWSRVFGELSKAQVFLEALCGSQSSDKGGSIGGSVGGKGAVRRFGDGEAPSFAEVVRSAVPSTALSEKQLASTVSSSDLDLLPSGTSEKQSELRSAINCFELETVVFDSCAVDRPIARVCGARGSVRDSVGWLAVDHFFRDLGRAFGRLKKGWLAWGLGLKPILGRLKKGWLALGLGLKPILGPLGFKMPKPFKAFKPLKSRSLRPSMDILDPRKGTDAVRGGHRLSARRRKPLKVTTTQPLDRSTLTSAPATGSETAQFSDVGSGSPKVSGADPVLGGCLIPFAPSEEAAPIVRNLPAAGSPQKPTKLLHFYNRKHKVKRASKMDMGQFAGDLISIAPGAVPLVGDQSSVSGGSSGLFSAFESSGFTGSKEVVLRAPADEAGKSLVHSSPAKGMLRRGFLMPRPCGGVSRRSPEPGQSSAVGFTSEAGQSSGISSERSKVLGEVFELPWNISEDGVEVEDGVLGANGYPEAVADALAIAPLLGISCGGDEKGFLDLLSDIEEGHKREGVFADEGGSVLKSKGWRERKNLECSLNFDVGSIGSGRVKNRSCLRV